MTYYDALIEDLNKYIVIIVHKQFYKFMTLNPQYAKTNIFQRDDNSTTITAYNLGTKTIETIPLPEIIEHIHKNFNDPIDNDKKILKILDWINSKIDAFIAKKPNKFTRTELFYNISQLHVIDIQNGVDKSNYIFDLIFNSDFILTANDIILNQITDVNREKIISGYKNLITVKIDEILAELYELKSQTSDEEDLTDIDTICQMYIDSANEFDNTNYKTLTEVFKNWPPLLLPRPNYIDSFLSAITVTSYDDSYIDFMQIVDASLTNDEIKELLEELNSLQTSSNNSDLSKYIDYLQYKLNNEHK